MKAEALAQQEVEVQETPVVEENTPQEEQPTEEVVSYSAYTVDQFRQYALIDLTSVLASCGEKDQYTAEVWNNIQTKYNAGKAAIEAAATKNDVTKAFEDAKAAIASVIPYANGAYSFVSLTNAQRLKF